MKPTLTIRIVILVPLILTACYCSAQDTIRAPLFSWQEMAPIPVRLGLSGGFTGFHEGALLYAGGSNFEKPHWEGGTKSYHRQVMVLEKPESAASKWKTASEELPYPVSDGATVETPAGLLCLGGTDGKNVVKTALLIKWDPLLKKATLDSAYYPSLPQPCSHLSAAVMGHYIYVAGGKDKNGKALSGFWRLDLESRKQWEELPSWPGASRSGSVLNVQKNGELACLYLFGGKSDTGYLKDGYVFNPKPGAGWSRISDLPKAAYLATGAPFGPSHILIFSGSDGHALESVSLMKSQNDYQFTKNILSYHTITDRWVTAGKLPVGLAGARAVYYQDKMWMIGGETAPSVRTNAVLVGTPGKGAEKGLISWPDYTVIILYLVILAGISIFFSKRNQTSEDYLLGGQRIPGWAAGISVMATQVSAIGFMTIPAKSYAVNWAYFIGVFTWFIAVPIVTIYFIPLIRKLRITSVYQYLESRFDIRVRMVAALFFLSFQLTRMGLVLYLPALALSAVTPLDTLSCILIMGLLSTLYTVMGGIEGVIWIEVVQALLLFCGALVCVVLGINGLDGGWDKFMDIAISNNKLSFGQWDWSLTSSTLFAVLIGNVFIRLGNLTTDQAIVQRYLTTPTTKEAQKTLWTDVWISIPWAIVVYLIGTVLYAYYSEHPQKLDPRMSTDGILPFFISQNAPAGISGLIIAGIFAASMSSSQSHIHSLATIITTDFYARFRKVNEAQTFKIARVFTLLLGLLSTILATGLIYLDIFSLLDFFQELTGLFIGASSGFFILGMFTVRSSATGALTGAFISVLTLVLVKSYTPLNFWLYSAIGFFACLIPGYLISLAFPGKPLPPGLTIYKTRKNPIE